MTVSLVLGQLMKGEKKKGSSEMIIMNVKIKIYFEPFLLLGTVMFCNFLN